MSHDPTATDRARLEAVRDRLEAVLASPETSPRDLPAVSREYRLTIEKLGALRLPSSSSAADEITARRRARGAS